MNRLVARSRMATMLNNNDQGCVTSDNHELASAQRLANSTSEVN